MNKHEYTYIDGNYMTRATYRYINMCIYVQKYAFFWGVYAATPYPSTASTMTSQSAAGINPSKNGFNGLNSINNMNNNNASNLNSINSTYSGGNKGMDMYVAIKDLSAYLPRWSIRGRVDAKYV